MTIMGERGVFGVSGVGDICCVTLHQYGMFVYGEGGNMGIRGTARSAVPRIFPMLFFRLSEF